MKSISGKKLLKIMESRGWYLVRVKGSHHILEHPNFDDKIIIPIHGNKDLKIGLLQSILKIANIKTDEL